MAWSGSSGRPGKWGEYVVVIVAGSNRVVADRGRSYTAGGLDDAVARRDVLRAGSAAAHVCRLVPVEDS